MIITIDTGGTKTLIAGFSPSGELLRATKFPTEKNQTDYTDSLLKALSNSFHDQPVQAISVGLPSVVVDNIGVWLTQLQWPEVDLRPILQPLYPNVPIFIDNDASLAGLAEARQRTPVPHLVLYLTLSTGIGSGIIIDGKLDPGLSKSEAGQAIVPYQGKLYQWEKIASGSAIYRHYGKYAHDITDQATWQEIVERIGSGLLSLIPFIQPDLIIIGGGVGSYFNRFGDLLTTYLQKNLAPHIPCPPIEQALHPEEAVVYGCYYYATDRLTHR